MSGPKVLELTSKFVKPCLVGTRGTEVKFETPSHHQVLKKKAVIIDVLSNFFSIKCKQEKKETPNFMVSMYLVIINGQ